MNLFPILYRASLAAYLERSIGNGSVRKREGERLLCRQVIMRVICHLTNPHVFVAQRSAQAASYYQDNIMKKIKTKSSKSNETEGLAVYRKNISNNAIKRMNL
jgi:hypothetical protein